ncbi:MAG: error-prone DNA polymerase [Actinomycetaceae bacterium]|nr:error-prone DNA polymerase [Actinomycetaceae bacterium]MDY6083224.1 error-prone DNA polymerase [Actinomycetaceae bacterium]
MPERSSLAHEGSRKTSHMGSQERLPIPYAALHVHSAFSFLEGASQPEDLVLQAQELGLSSLALTDRNGFPGVVPFAQAGREANLPVLIGTELKVSDEDHPQGRDLVVLTRSKMAYQNLSHTLGKRILAHPGGDDLIVPSDEIEGQAASGELMVLAAGSHATLAGEEGIDTTSGVWAEDNVRRSMATLRDRYGSNNVAIELQFSARPHDRRRIDFLSSCAHQEGIPSVASRACAAASTQDQRLADVFAAVKNGAKLGQRGSHRPAASHYLLSGAQMADIFADYPESLEASVEIAEECYWDFFSLRPRLPQIDVPEGMDDAQWLAHLVEEGGVRAYGTREKNPHAWEQIDHEMSIINALHFAGYFLIVYDIVRFCADHGIWCQGRGSAANSAVCYALGITAVDAVRHHMLFERFLSPERSEPPDIDIDIEADSREDVIQYIYQKYGRENAAQVANVISYKSRSARRDVRRAFGYRDDDHVSENHRQLIDSLVTQMRSLPRHLGIHSGGMVVCERPVIDYCPVRWARIPGRTVLQWDKDSCARMGLVKFDLLSLRALTAMRKAMTWVNQQRVADQRMADRLSTLESSTPLDLHNVPEDDPRVYDLLCAADTIGVFQVESRAQMATLPRLKPRTFYDLVIEVALIRPGPIQGDSVNPYIKRRCGQEEVTYLHPLLKPALEKTLGVPLFQEQLMRIAMDAAGLSAAEADSLRQAMGSKRSREKMLKLRQRLIDGMASKGIDEPTAQEIYTKLEAFASFGFPESHAFSFAYLVYTSGWLKVHAPEAFYAGILASQPMGFYSPNTVIADARRHGVKVLRADVNFSDVHSTVVSVAGSVSGSGRAHGDFTLASPGMGYAPGADKGDSRLNSATMTSQPQPQPQPHRQPLDVNPDLAVRLGLASISGMTDVAQRIVDARQSGPFTSTADLARRAHISQKNLERLSEAGALNSLGITRREGLWQAHAAHLSDETQVSGSSGSPYTVQSVLAGFDMRPHAVHFKPLSPEEVTIADFSRLGYSPEYHPVAFVRRQLSDRGVVPIGSLDRVAAGHRVWIGGIVTHRQQPPTAHGFVFLSLEDETGMANITCSPGMWTRFSAVGVQHSGLLVRGMLCEGDESQTFTADRIEPLALIAAPRARNFR